jgi:hypothetical protein
MKSGAELDLVRDISRRGEICLHSGQVGEGMGAYLRKSVAKART